MHPGRSFLRSTSAPGSRAPRRRFGPETRRVLAGIRSTKLPEVVSAPIWIFADVSDPVTDPQVAGYLAGLRTAGHTPKESARTISRGLSSTPDNRTSGCKPVP